LREKLGAAGGKGGGTRDFAQGTVPGTANVESILHSALASLRN
jgi:alanyl-tRNA synthetase